MSSIVWVDGTTIDIEEKGIGNGGSSCDAFTLNVHRWA